MVHTRINKRTCEESCQTGEFYTCDESQLLISVTETTRCTEWFREKKWQIAMATASAFEVL